MSFFTRLVFFVECTMGVSYAVVEKKPNNKVIQEFKNLVIREVLIADFNLLDCTDNYVVDKATDKAIEDYKKD
ncbi:10497_t:CDS:2, partial [Racocetra persica]